MNRLRHAFTLVELIVCVAIIAIVMAIATPVFVRAKKSAQIQASMSNLHQMFIAGKLYQMDWDGDGRYGDLDVMGLPSVIWPQFRLSDLGGKPAKSPCGLDPGWMGTEIVVHHYIYRPGEGGPKFAQYATMWKENMLFFSDLNCDDHSIPVYSREFAHRGLGVLLSGRLVNLYKKGQMTGDDYWWSQPSE